MKFSIHSNRNHFILVPDVELLDKIYTQLAASTLRLRPAFYVRVTISRKVILVHLSVTISKNAFPLAGMLHPRGKATWWATLLYTCCPYQCNTHLHNLELVKTVKMASNDQANSADVFLCAWKYTFFHRNACWNTPAKHVHGKPA